MATTNVGRDPKPTTGIMVSVQSHLAAMAARNSRLLARVANLAEIRETANRLRQQVRALRGQIHLSHTGVNRSVPWDRPFIMPALRPLNSSGRAGGKAGSGRGERGG